MISIIASFYNPDRVNPIIQIFQLTCKRQICVFFKAVCTRTVKLSATEFVSRGCELLTLSVSLVFSSAQVLHRFPVCSAADGERHRRDGERRSGESRGLHTVSSVQLLHHRSQSHTAQKRDIKGPVCRIKRNLLSDM